MAIPHHSLVVGATGMLRGVARHLAARGDTVSAIARGAPALQALADEVQAAGLPGRIVPLALDYADDAALRRAVKQAIARHGPLATVVAWVREGAPGALMAVAETADREAGEAAPRRCRLFRVAGSAAADPARPRTVKGARFRALEGVLYREVVLGWRVEGGAARWNTKDEIAEGVIDAIERDAEESVVGTVRPWETRPARG